MGPRLEALAARQGTFRVRRINIDEWGSPVANQYGVSRLPTLLLYDGDKLVSEDKRQILSLLRR
jgi:hypothetical protein